MKEVGSVVPSFVLYFTQLYLQLENISCFDIHLTQSVSLNFFQTVQKTEKRGVCVCVCVCIYIYIYMLYTTYIYTYTYIHMYTYIQHMDKFFIDDIFALINLNSLAFSLGILSFTPHSQLFSVRTTSNY